MMKTYCPLAFGFLVLWSSQAWAVQAATDPAVQEAAVAAVRLEADTPSSTPAGTRFVAPVDWTLRRSGNATVMEAPEGGSFVVLVDSDAKDADAAVAAAWAAYTGAPKWPVKMSVDRTAKDGWEQIRDYQYETSANEERGVYVRAVRRGGQWTVLIEDVANAVGGKRGAQIGKIYDRLLPAGYERESFAGRTAHALDGERAAALKDFIETSRQALDVPGIAVGVVQDGKLVFAEGFGVRELGKPEKVDADTLFMIASNTKALTTLMLARQVEQGLFDWDTPVTQVYPAFKLGDAETTRQVLVKHLICACTGMPRQDMEWLFESEGATPATVMASLGTMMPTSKFGELFQYSNLMAAAAGYVGGYAAHPDRELGAGYDALMQELVFDPLGMASTTFDNARALRADHAEPHGRDVDGHTRVASMDLNTTIGSARPAGGAWSNINDMLKYVQMELDNGLLADGTRYIASEDLLERRVPQVAVGNDTDYGMGLGVDRTYGIPVVSHGGALLGFHSDMMWWPEHGVGAVILTNADPGVYIPGPLKRRLMELMFDGNPEAAKDVAVNVERIRVAQQAERKRLEVPANAEAVAELASLYRSPILGDIAVSQANGAIQFDFGLWDSEVASRRNDDGSLSFMSISPGEEGIEFVVTDDAGKRSLTLRDAQHEYVFAEVAAGSGP